ncbi:hypothetical protein PFISCL1PPCAC_23171, partial [Pristionchus fissidentatus]
LMNCDGQNAMLPYITLESLPKENLYQILSTLPMRNRRILRECNKSMKEAVEQSDLIASCVDLEFFRDQHLTMTFHGSDDVFKLRACVMDWAIRSSVPINSLTLDIPYRDPQVFISFIAHLPRVTRLIVTTDYNFTESLLAIARMGHANVLLSSCDYDDRIQIGTIRDLIEIVHSSEQTLEFAIKMHPHSFRSILASINLREEGNRLLDVTNADAPVVWGYNNGDNPFYYLDYGSGYLKVFFDRHAFMHTVTIVNGEKPHDLGPSYPMILPQ